MAKKKSKKKIVIIFIVLFLLLAAVIGMVFFNKNEKPTSVSVTKVERRTIVQSVSATGKIEAETEVKISSETSGEIEIITVKEGDTVRKGQLLVKIKPDIIETQLEQYRAAVESAEVDIRSQQTAYEQAKKEYNRLEELFKKQFTSKQELERAKTTLDQSMTSIESAKSRLTQAKAVLSQFQRSEARTKIYSPITGVVTKLEVETGEKVVGTAQMAGTEMMRISDLSDMNAVVEVDENDIVMVKIGDTTDVEIDAIPDVVYKAVVREIGHSATTSSLGTQEEVTNFEVKVKIVDNEPRLRPGMSCNVSIRTQIKYNVLAVPLQSVTVRDEKIKAKQEEKKNEEFAKVEKEDKKKEKPQSIVFVRNGNIVNIAKVKTGISDDGFIEIIEGLTEGQEVVSGSFFAISKELKDSSKITIDTLSKKMSPEKK